MLTLKVERASGVVEIYSGKTIRFDKKSNSYDIDDQRISPIVNSGDSSFVTNENGKTVFSWGSIHFSADSDFIKGIKSNSPEMNAIKMRMKRKNV